MLLQSLSLTFIHSLLRSSPRTPSHSHPLPLDHQISFCKDMFNRILWICSTPIIESSTLTAKDGRGKLECACSQLFRRRRSILFPESSLGLSRLCSATFEQLFAFGYKARKSEQFDRKIQFMRLCGMFINVQLITFKKKLKTTFL